MAQLNIFRPKIVPPLGDTVGFINGKESDCHTSEPIEETFTEKALRGHVKQIKLSAVQLSQHLARLFRLE